RGFSVIVFGVRLAVVGDSDALLDELDRFVLPWLPRAPADGGALDQLVEVRGTGEGARLQVSIGGAAAGEVSGFPAAVAIVQRALAEAVVRKQTDFAVVHSGVVAHGGRAILLPGPTSTGKSTLVAELVRRGAAYFSDEYALLDAEGRVH